MSDFYWLEMEAEKQKKSISDLVRQGILKFMEGKNGANERKTKISQQTS